MPLASAICSTSFSVLTASLGYSTVLPAIARIIARSSSPICDGPSSPMLTPTCEPASLRFACEMPATRIWSKARVKKRGERGRKRHLAARAETGGHADHVLLGDETFGETVREFLEEFFRVGGILRVAVHRHDALVHLADARERVAVGFARGDRIAGFVSERRIAGGRGVVRRGQLVRRGNRHADAGFGARLKFGDGLGGFFLVQRFAVPAVLVLQK